MLFGKLLRLIFAARLSEAAVSAVYWQYSVVEDQLNVTETLSHPLATGCAIKCDRMGYFCNGYRFDAAAAMCHLGEYRKQGHFETAFEPGGFTTWWKTKRSPDGCFVRFDGSVGTRDQIRDVCGRVGGRTPEIRAAEDMDRMFVASHGTMLGLSEDPAIANRWLYDSDGSVVPTEFAPSSEDGEENGPCARFDVKKNEAGDGWVYQIARTGCVVRMGYQCQFCK